MRRTQPGRTGVTAGVRRHRVVLIGLLVALAVPASCTAALNSGTKRTAQRSVTRESTPSPSGPATSTSPAPTAASSFADQPGWVPVSNGRSGVAVDQRSVTVPDGRTLVVTRFHPSQVVFHLHIGTSDPPVGRAVLGPESGSAVSGYERPLLLAAFNGGFKANAGVGGVEVDEQVLTPLLGGEATLVIDTNGVAHVGRWGQDLPYPREHVASARQNLLSLITASQVNPLFVNSVAWGSTIGGGAAVARSAAGEDAAGDILYTGSMHADPVDLADALLTAGATSAMQLDINPEWVQLALAGSPGGVLRAGVPGQNRPADQYLVGWTRDFVTVLVR